MTLEESAAYIPDHPSSIVFEPGPGRNPLEEQAEDEAATGRPRCIGCGRFLKVDADWNQCADCDTREEGLSAFFA